MWLTVIAGTLESRAASYIRFSCGPTSTKPMVERSSRSIIVWSLLQRIAIG